MVRMAEHAGFCSGVQSAVDLVDRLLEQGERVCTLGPLIHNPQVVSGLEERGVRVANSVDEIPQGYTAVIRSHGVEKGVLRELERRAVPVCDATCPFVRRIHDLASRAAAEGKTVLIMGNVEHPEVKGILSHTRGLGRCFLKSNEIVDFWQENKETDTVLLCQTTYSWQEWQKCREIAENVYTSTVIFDTICNATMLRQESARQLARTSDLMIVVGGYASSNTGELVQACREHCRTLWIERPEEIRGVLLTGVHNIGVTAGASTPAFIIKEVQGLMSDVEIKQGEMSFEEMLDQSFKTIRTQERVTGVVTNVSANEIAVDIGTKHAGYVPLYEFTDDPNAKLDELVKVGEELELLVLRLNDVEGTAMLSKKRLDAIAGFEKVVEAEASGETLQGVVVDVVKGGVIALTNSVRVFVPASQATLSRGQELESLLRQPVEFKILETNRQRRRAVGSIRAVLKEQRKHLEEKFWETAETGKVYQGTVKSLTSYGAFVDLGGVDGMVHISELSWKRIKHPSEVVNVGDLVEVYIRDIDAESKKISLGYKKSQDNPWEILRRDYKPGDIADVKVVSMTPFGAFAQIVPGVDGLIHISQISSQRINKPGDALEIGQEVKAAITDIDFEKKRVSLSIRALLNEEEAQEGSGAYHNGASQVVAEVGPDSTVIAEGIVEISEDQADSAE